MARKGYHFAGIKESLTDNLQLNVKEALDSLFKICWVTTKPTTTKLKTRPFVF